MGRAERDDTELLERIVALLFSLANLAESFGARPGPVGLCVLWVLTRAERAARNCLFGAGLPFDHAAEAAFLASQRVETADAATRLAFGFRALAVWLRLVLGKACPASPFATGYTLRIAKHAVSLAKRLRQLRPLPIDTS